MNTCVSSRRPELGSGLLLVVEKLRHVQTKVVVENSGMYNIFSKRWSRPRPYSKAQIVWVYFCLI